MSARAYTNTASGLPSHVVAPFLELNHSLAIIASLPTLLLRHLYQTLGPFVLWTFSSCVKLTVAQNTDLGTALATTGIFSPSSQIDADLTGFDPLTAALCRTVEVLGSGVLFKLLVPKSLESVIEQAINVFQRDAFFSAAARWHVCRVLDR